MSSTPARDSYGANAPTSQPSDCCMVLLVDLGGIGAAVVEAKYVSGQWDSHARLPILPLPMGLFHSVFRSVALSRALWAPQHSAPNWRKNPYPRAKLAPQPLSQHEGLAPTSC